MRWESEEEFEGKERGLIILSEGERAQLGEREREFLMVRDLEAGRGWSVR